MSTSMSPYVPQFPVESFRRIPTRLDSAGVARYSAVVPITSLPPLLGSDWSSVNARNPKLTGSVPRQILGTLVEDPEWFVICNRGLLLLAEDIDYDDHSKVLKVGFSDPRRHGIADGRHSYEVALAFARGLGDVEDNAAFITVEILTGVPDDKIVDVVGARNTSRQVADEDLDNLAGKFDSLKAALAPAGLVDKIAWKDQEDAPVDVREIIASLTAFDREQWDADSQPVIAYSSKAMCLKRFERNTANYEAIYPIAADILKLSEFIRATIPDQYNDEGGRFGGLKGCDPLKTATWLPLTGAKTKYSFPAPYYLPILASFRSMIEMKDGQYVWGKGIDPIEAVKGGLANRMFKSAVVQSINRVHNPQSTGKDPNVWALCYTMAENFFLRYTP